MLEVGEMIQLYVVRVELGEEFVGLCNLEQVIFSNGDLVETEIVEIIENFEGAFSQPR